MQQLSGRNAVVVGGGHGIGRGIALALAREGMHVAVLDIEEHAAKAVAKELAALGSRTFAARCDVTDEAQLAEVEARVRSELGPVHLLSNNAGVSAPQGPITQKNELDWQWVFSVNLHGIVHCVQAFLPGMRSHGEDAHIVNTSSTAGLLTIPELEVGVYTASKYACNAYSESLRAELAAEGIGVSVLCPGLIATDLAQTSARNRPERFGGPMAEPPGMPEAMRAQAMSAEEVGPIVVRGVRANRLHILTHPELVLPMVAARFDAIREDGEGEIRDREAAG